MEISCSASLQRMHLDLICLGSQRWDGGTCWAERASLAGSICRSSQRSASAHETFPFSHGGYPQIIHFRWGCSTNVMVSSWNHIPMMWSTISTISINAARIFHEINHPASSDKGVAPWHWKPSDNGHTTAASYWTNQSGVSVVSSSQWSLMHVYKSCIVAEQVCMSKIFKDSDPNICFRFLPSMGKKTKTWNLTIMDSWPSPELLSDETHKNQHAEGVEEDLATCLPCTPLKASVNYCGWLQNLAVDRCWPSMFIPVFLGSQPSQIGGLSDFPAAHPQYFQHHHSKRRFVTSIP